MPVSADVETALAAALDRASRAGQWDIVGALAAELQARRMARTGAVDALDIERERRR